MRTAVLVVLMGVAASGVSPAQTHASVTSAVATIVPTTVGIALMGGRNGEAGRVTSDIFLWGGLVLGPAAGYANEGSLDLAQRGLTIRVGALMGAMLVVVNEKRNNGASQNVDLEQVVMWVAIPTIVVSGAIDIVKANERVRSRIAGLNVGPWRGVDGSRGVAVLLRF